MNANRRVLMYPSAPAHKTKERSVGKVLSTNTVTHKTVSEIRMRERMSMKSKMLGALALLTLIGALFAMQTADTNSHSADAATGSIQALNVGTCLTTDATSFAGENCAHLKGDGANKVKWEVRDKITEVSTLYATYAFDPKSDDVPRIILQDSDLLKISIKDTDRDKRTGVLIRGATNEATITDDDSTGLGFVIREDLDKGVNLTYETHDPDTADPNDTTDDDVIKFSSEDVLGDGIEVYQGTPATASVISASGNVTLNFKRNGCDGEPTSATDDDNDGATCDTTATSPSTVTLKNWYFHPGDFDVDKGAIVKFYGCLDDETTDDNCTDSTDGPIELLDDLTVDEDKSNGNAAGDTAPWLNVNASVPSGKEIVILAIYYRTSEHEDLVGGETYHYCDTGTVEKTQRNDVLIANGVAGSTAITGEWKCVVPYTSDDTNLPTGKKVGDTKTQSDDAKMRDGELDVVFTKSEKDVNTALKVRATAGNGGSVANLHLREIDRFSGTYQGYVRLTDGSARGKDPTASPPVNTPQDWGRDAKDASGHGFDGKTRKTEQDAVLAVPRGPVTIEYTDSSGSTRTFDIMIDQQPPEFQIDNPVNGSSSDDHTPEFTGTVRDNGSGIVEDSFRLVIDNTAEKDKNVYFVFDDRTSNSGARRPFSLTNADDVTAPNAGINHPSKYTGNSAGAEDDVLGVATAEELYDLDKESCSGQWLCHIKSERHDDGASSTTFDDSIRLDLQEEAGVNYDTDGEEHVIDFQAFALDRAGNVGFSDTDESKPRFMNDLGTKKANRKNPNLFGYFSAHVITLDEKDPVALLDQSVTGYYGLDDDSKMIRDASGIAVAFDGKIDPNSVSTSTFSVELDDESMAKVASVSAEGNYVFLKLTSALDSDATPKVSIASGEKVADLAGNESTSTEFDAFDLRDGIAPTLTVTLSGGSGKGIGKEGPDKLTRDQMTIHVTSNEALSGRPKIAVVCNSLMWKQTSDLDDKVTSHDIDDFIANRSGATSVPTPGETPDQTAKKTGTGTYGYTCGYGADSDDNYDVVISSGTLRPAQSWDYVWSQDSTIEDGTLTVVAFAPDGSAPYKDSAGASLKNWGSTSTTFSLDRELKSPLDTGGGQVQPLKESKETKPWILLHFEEGTSVTLDSVTVKSPGTDKKNVTSGFSETESNKFIYWPDTLSLGKHEVEVDASDAAGNEKSFEWTFEAKTRVDFNIELYAGWNAISVPADPVSTAIASVFKNPSITSVVGWSVDGENSGWRIAVRRDGVWESNASMPLNEIKAKYGYWVQSTSFITQPVALTTNQRGVGGPRTPLSIETTGGWNFVGVIDQDGDQTEGNAFGNNLLSGEVPVIASDYLGKDYKRAYTWNATLNQFEELRPDETMTIGDGVWVFYEGGIAP